MDDAIDLDLDDASQDDARSGSESPVADEATVAAAAAIERELSTTAGADSVEPRSSPPCIEIDEDDSNSDAPQPLKPQWIIDTQFKKEQQRLQMSEDPRDWYGLSMGRWFSDWFLIVSNV